MRILQLTPGTGNFHCGSCLRDNALVRGLRARGHAVLMVPLYLPLVTDEPSESGDVPIFMSGLSVFLGRQFPVPGWLDRALSSPVLLRFASRLAGLTTAKDLGESAVAMLSGGHGEIERLITWLHTQPPPDIICLSNSLLSALARRLKDEFHVPIVCSMQGEDSFLDNLPEPYRQRSWELLTQRCTDIDQFIAVSQYFADLMQRRLTLSSARVAIVHPGIVLDDTPPTPPATPTIGFLARMHHGKGLGILVDAFLQLDIPGARLRIAGAMTNQDKRYVESLQRKLGDRAEFFPNLDHADKQDFLHSLSVLSVPANYGEAFGLYVIEALACGVPVVQPRHGAFPEVLAKTGGGLLCDPNNPAALAAALRELLRDSARARQFGEAGRQVVRAEFSVEAMTQKTEALLQQVIHAA